MKRDNKNDDKLGRFLSLVLRHQPSAAGITLDQNGWADVEALVAGTKRTGRHINKDILERIVRENNKNRYSFNEDHTKIRANQGHSLAVDVELESQTPPDLLYHGTAVDYLDSIMKQGITKQNRQHVHLSDEKETAVRVGKRHGKPVVLAVDAAAMVKDGLIFWCSENGVWLCDCVPKKYLTLQPID